MYLNKTIGRNVLRANYIFTVVFVSMFFFSSVVMAGGDGPGDADSAASSPSSTAPAGVANGAGQDNGTSVGAGSGVGVGDAGAPGGAGPGSSGPGADGSSGAGAGADGGEVGGDPDGGVGGSGCGVPEEFGGCPAPVDNSGCNEPGGCPTPSDPQDSQPPPPPPQSPSFSGNGGSGPGGNISIIGGNSATLTFACVDSTSSSGVNFSTGGAPSGSVVVSPVISTQFTVICSNGGQNFVNVNVFWPVLNISANPTRVKAENVSLITWSTLGDDDILSCSVSGPNFFASGKSGSKVTAPITEESTYTLTCPTTENTLSVDATVKLVPAFEEF